MTKTSLCYGCYLSTSWLAGYLASWLANTSSTTQQRSCYGYYLQDKDRIECVLCVLCF